MVFNVFLTEHRHQAVLGCVGPAASQGELAGTTQTGNTLLSSLDHSGLGNYEQNPPPPLAVSERDREGREREKEKWMILFCAHQRMNKVDSRQFFFHVVG